MTMRLYETARREIVPFEPGRVVTMYTCGITPYDSAHLGHAATYLTYDVLQRRLRDLGHETRCVRNVTDVDDDILRKARSLGVHYLDLAAEEIARFDEQMRSPRPAAELRRATRDLGDPGHPRLHRDGARVRPRLPGRRRRLLRRIDVPAFRPAEPARPRRDARDRRRARRQRRRPAQAGPPRLRAVAAVACRRAGLGVAVGTGTPGLAHRVLGARDARARSHDRPPRRRAPTSSSRTTSARPPSRKRRRGRPSCATGCTSAWSASTARRWRSPWAISSSSATC